MPICEPCEEGVILAVKVVPGASRDRIVGRLGERLKVAVAKPAEKGAANKAVCAVLAKAMGLRPSDIEILHGATHPEKDILLRGLTPADARCRLSLAH